MTTTDETIEALVVDDEPTFGETVATMLEREDDRFEAWTAESAEAGLDVLSTERIDCVLSDYGMPGTDGLEFLESIREEHGELPFVLVTGEGDEAVASEAISAGVTDYVRKRRGTEQYSLLANRLADAVEKRRARRSLRRQKRELEELHERFQSFVKHSPDVITIIDADGTIRYTSPTVEQILGYDQDELVGHRAYEHTHPDDRQAVRAAFRALSESDDETTECFECRYRHADGSWVWIESVASNRTGTDGDGFLLNSRDVSDRKAHERELEAKTERLNEFAGIVSHDLQTPITVADARLDLAIDECNTEHLPAIRDALDRMEEIIDATLSLARDGRVVDETEPVELAATARRWWDSMERDGSTPGGVGGDTEGATLEIEADRLTIEADRERLRRAIENLFANAIDHGGEAVTVAVGKIDDEGFFVADDGPGIHGDADAEIIFKTGFSMSSDGTGFGLAIVEEIVDAHGWTIEATESADGGARFEVTGVEFAH
jgi:PAS domain S-box-containing protein